MWSNESKACNLITSFKNTLLDNMDLTMKMHKKQLANTIDWGSLYLGDFIILGHAALPSFAAGRGQKTQNRKSHQHSPPQIQFYIFLPYLNKARILSLNGRNFSISL